MKAYQTRVGKGPFPTEVKDEIGNVIRERGGEYGTTTGRPRRCGWLDLVMVRYATIINGLTGLAITKLDVLTGLEKIPVCVAYELDGKTIKTFPANIKDLARCKPVWEELDGWSDFNISNAIKQGYDGLPRKMREYIEFIAEECKVPVKIVSIGKRRRETIML